MSRLRTVSMLVMLSALLVPVRLDAAMLFEQELGDATVAVVVKIPEDQKGMVPIVQREIEGAVREVGFRVLDAEGTRKLQEDDVAKAVIQGDNASAFLDIKERFEADVVLIVDAQVEARQSLGEQWIATAIVSLSAYQSASGEQIRALTSQGMGTPGRPGALGTTSSAARQRAVKVALSSIFPDMGLRSLNIGPEAYRITPRLGWKRAVGSPLLAMACAPSEEAVAVLTADRLQVLDLEDGKPRASWEVSAGKRGAVAVSAQNRIAAGTSKGRVLVCSEGSQDCVLLEGAKPRLKTILAVDFSADGQRLVALDKAGRVAVWDLVSPEKPLAIWSVHKGAPSSYVEFTGNGRVASAGEKGELGFWNPDRRGERVKQHDFSETGLSVVAVDADSTGQLVAVATKVVRIDRLAASEMAGGTGMRSPGGRLPSVKGDDFDLADHREKIKIISGDSGAALRDDIEAHEKKITGLAFAPSTRFLASAALDGAVKVWDFERAEPCVDLDFVADDLGDRLLVDFGPGGKFLVAGSGKGDLASWKLE